MKLQLRLLIVMVAALLAMAGIMVLQHQIDVTHTNKVLASETEQRQVYFNAVLSIDQQPLATLARDYSFWDDMVTFAKAPSSHRIFAQDNIDTSLETFGVDVAWVYGLNGTAEYVSQAQADKPLGPLALPASFFTRLNIDKFAHFYTKDDGNLIEVRAATIVPGDDPNHLQPAAGYWIVARRIDASYVTQLSNVSQSTTTLLPAGVNAHNMINRDDIAIVTPLKDWDETVVGQILADYKVPLIADLNRAYLQQLILVGILGAVLILLVTAVLWWWVLRPIRQITQSIATNSPDIIAKLSRSHGEFGRLAYTVQQFFQQKVQIAEDAVRKADLENLNKEKSVFLSVAAHELKGPISIVHMLTNDLPSMSERLTPVQFNEQMSMVSSQTEKMATIINDLRAASQGDANNQLDYQPVAITFDEFMARELKAIQLITDQKIITTGTSGKTIYADPSRLSQVVTNLVRNASKYSPRDATIDVDIMADDQIITFTITDHGIGIPEADQGKIFERFFRASNAVNQYQGLGIGLSVCLQIVEQFGGSIKMKSVEQHGSTVVVQLPVARH